MPCIYAGCPYHADPQSAALYPPLWVTMLALRVMRYGHYPVSALVTEVLAAQGLNVLLVLSQANKATGTPKESQ